MSRRPIDSRIETGREEVPEGATVSPDDFREALSHWASTVTVAAVRDDARIYATTVTSFMPVSDDPGRVVISLGPGAQVLPFLDEGVEFGISFLAPDQRRLASDFADPFPVGPSPFPEKGVPLVADAVVGLTCTVERVIEVEGDRLVLALVVGTRVNEAKEPLLYHRRGYRTLE